MKFTYVLAVAAALAGVSVFTGCEKKEPTLSERLEQASKSTSKAADSASKDAKKAADSLKK